MVVILDELSPLEFFKYGGIVKINVNKKLSEECKLKNKYTFFEYKNYVRFFRNLYMTYLHLHPEIERKDIYDLVNSYFTFSASIGKMDYVLDLKYDKINSYEYANFYFSNERNDYTGLDKRDPYGIKNVNFSLIDETDERWDVFQKQRLERGFDDSETWSLDGTIAKFIEPRLEAFYEDTKNIGCHPANMCYEDWLTIIEKLINGFKLLANDEIKTDEEEKIEQETLELFAKYFHALWT